jgi:hypothetical protein
MYPCDSQRKSEMDPNRPKHGGNQTKSPPASEGKQVHSALYRVYTETLHDLTAVLKESPAKGEIARPQLLHLRPSSNSVSKEDESRNLQTTPKKEPRSLQHPPRESTTTNRSRNLKFPPGTSSSLWGQLKWRLPTGHLWKLQLWEVSSW